MIATCDITCYRRDVMQQLAAFACYRRNKTDELFVICVLTCYRRDVMRTRGGNYSRVGGARPEAECRQQGIYGSLWKRPH